MKFNHEDRPVFTGRPIAEAPILTIGTTSEGSERYSPRFEAPNAAKLSRYPGVALMPCARAFPVTILLTRLSRTGCTAHHYSIW